jgi:regulator of protease activity HflC (stomatin/prohibitin superfamily)
VTDAAGKPASQEDPQRAIGGTPVARVGERDPGMVGGRRRWLLSSSFTIPAVTALVFLALGAGACATVPPGYAGVVLTPSGTRARPLGEGVTVVPLLSQVALYDLRVQTRAEDFEAVAADGAPVVANSSVFAYRVEPTEVVALHREVGPHYYAVVIRPLIRAEVRRVLADFRSDQINAAAVPHIQTLIQARLGPQLRRYHVVADSLNLRNLVVHYSATSYAEILDTGVLEQKVLAIPQQLAIARQRADVLRQQANGLAAQFHLVAPTLTSKTLADSATHAFGLLLAAPGTEVVSGSGATILEVQ